MPKYRKKPVEIDAVQYGPYSAPSIELLEFLSKSPSLIALLLFQHNTSDINGRGQIYHAIV